MAIRGIGTDLVPIKRIAATYERFGNRFLNRAFHPMESTHFTHLAQSNKKAALAYLAGRWDISCQFALCPRFTPSIHRWAAKEAVYKACNCGRLQFPHLLVVSDGGGPVVQPSKPALRMMSDAGIHQVLLSISHDADAGLAIAFATAVSKT